MSKHSAFNMLLDLDALFDTRMGTLICLEEHISKHLPLMDYRNRKMDNFEQLTNGHIKQSDFEARYSKRDYDVISKSMTTGIVPIMIHYLEGLRERLFRGVDVDEIRVDLNVYPYQLPGPIIQTIKGCLETLLPPYVTVTAVSLSPEQMSPQDIEYRYNGWTTYDFHKWLELHNEQLLVHPLNGLSVILPRIFKEDPRERVVDDSHEAFDPEHRFGHLELVMEDYVHLEHIPVQDFCFLLPGTYRVDA